MTASPNHCSWTLPNSRRRDRPSPPLPPPTNNGGSQGRSSDSRRPSAGRRKVQSAEGESPATTVACRKRRCRGDMRIPRHRDSWSAADIAGRRASLPKRTGRRRPAAAGPPPAPPACWTGAPSARRPSPPSSPRPNSRGRPGWLRPGTSGRFSPPLGDGKPFDHFLQQPVHQSWVRRRLRCTRRRK